MIRASSRCNSSISFPIEPHTTHIQALKRIHRWYYRSMETFDAHECQCMLQNLKLQHWGQNLLGKQHNIVSCPLIQILSSRTHKHRIIEGTSSSFSRSATLLRWRSVQHHTSLPTQPTFLLFDLHLILHFTSTHPYCSNSTWRHHHPILTSSAITSSSCQDASMSQAQPQGGRQRHSQKHQNHKKYSSNGHTKSNSPLCEINTYLCAIESLRCKERWLSQFGRQTQFLSYLIPLTLNLFYLFTSPLFSYNSSTRMD